MTDRELMQQALEALEQSVGTCFDQYSHHEVMSRPEHFMNRAMEALRERLAQPEQEPVAWRWKERINGDFDSWVVTSSEPPPYAIEKQPLYTAPPQRQPLTDEEIDLIYAGVRAVHHEIDAYAFARAIEQAHGIKGEA